MGRDCLKIVVDPTNGDVYAAVGANGGGVWMSTDHGAHWTNTSTLSGDSVTDLAIDSAGDVYAGVGTTGGQMDEGVYLCPAHCAQNATPQTFTEMGGTGNGLTCHFTETKAPPFTASPCGNFKISLADPSDPLVRKRSTP